jgi:hypothetical protein
MAKNKSLPLALILPVGLSSCGLSVPEKNFLANGSEVNEFGYSNAGMLEHALVNEVKCEITRGIWRVYNAKNLSKKTDWLWKPTISAAKQQDQGKDKSTNKGKDNAPNQSGSTWNGWGSSASMQIQVEEQTQLNPGIGVTEPFHNAYALAAGPATYPLTPATLAAPTISAIPQSFNLGIGVIANANATRQETMQFTFNNEMLLRHAKEITKPGEEYKCYNDGFLTESNLKIDDFIYDKATVAAPGNLVDTGENWAPYNTFQEIITFVITYGGGVTPTWKFTRVTANPNTPTVQIQRNEINTLVITLGPLDTGKGKMPSPTQPWSLNEQAAQAHNAATQASLIGQANKAITP